MIRRLALVGVLFVIAGGLSAQTAAHTPASLPPHPAMARTHGRASGLKAVSPRQGHWGVSAYTLDVPSHPLVDAYLQRFGDPPGFQETVISLRRAHEFRGLIATSIQARGLPPELLWVPLIESSYRTSVVSRSGARGLWQFMPASAVYSGLTVSAEVDERLDFSRATEAALTKLEGNYRYFGDWYLALAAYNCGLGRLSRIIEATGINDFWELLQEDLLPPETARYVPKFVAAMQVAGSSGRRGGPLTWEKSLQWARVETHRLVDLELLAYVSQIPIATLKRSNPQLLKGAFPSDRSYGLNIPSDHEASLRAALSDPRLELVKIHQHRIHTGDTLYGLSRFYGVSVGALQRANPILVPDRLMIGETVRVPLAAGAAVPSADLDTLSTSAGVEFTSSRIVADGDTLWAMAMFYGITPEELARENHRDLGSPLIPGEVLSVPTVAGSDFAPPKPKTPAPAGR